MFDGQSLNPAHVGEKKYIMNVFVGQALKPLGSETCGFLYVSALEVFICMRVCVCDERLLSDSQC